MSCILASHPFVDPSGNAVGFFLLAAGMFFANVFCGVVLCAVGCHLDRALNPDRKRIGCFGIIGGLGGIAFPSALLAFFVPTPAVQIATGIVVVLQWMIFIGLAKELPI